MEKSTVEQSEPASKPQEQPPAACSLPTATAAKRPWLLVGTVLTVGFIAGAAAVAVGLASGNSNSVMAGIIALVLLTFVLIVRVLPGRG